VSQRKQFLSKEGYPQTLLGYHHFRRMPPIATDSLTGAAGASITTGKGTVTDNAGSISNPAVETATVNGPHTAILSRIPWRPPVAVKGEGIYLDLEDGTRIIDGVGGAAVTCIGNSHPKILRAISDQLNELICMLTFLRISLPSLFAIDLHRRLQCPTIQ